MTGPAPGLRLEPDAAPGPLPDADAAPGSGRILAPGAKRRRAVILVGNPANPYSRAIRIGRTLAEQGFEVEIAATFEEDAPLEERHGEIVLRRYPPSGRFASVAATHGKQPSAAKKRWSLAARILRAPKGRFVAWLYWPHIVRGWWNTLSTELAPADLYHSCGTLPIAAALAARERDRRAGRDSKVILDVIDITMESNNVLRIPTLFRQMLGRRERGWARRADAHTAVNEVVARKATGRWRLARTPTVVPNYPEPWAPPPGTPPADRIREATGLPATTRICLFWGRLGPYVGLDQAAEAVLQVPDTALVVLGFGRGWDRSVARDADPKYAGRHFTLPVVHPDELASWVASADVALCTLPPLSYNQRFATPNKFLEAMAGGTPIVLGPKLPTMETLLRREDLGRVAASMEPDDIAAAIREILDLSATERAAWRERIAATARARYSWPLAAAAYLDLVSSLGLTEPRPATS